MAGAGGSRHGRRTVSGAVLGRPLAAGATDRPGHRRRHFRSAGARGGHSLSPAAPALAQRRAEPGRQGQRRAPPARDRADRHDGRQCRRPDRAGALAGSSRARAALGPQIARRLALAPGVVARPDGAARSRAAAGGCDLHRGGPGAGQTHLRRLRLARRRAAEELPRGCLGQSADLYRPPARDAHRARQRAGSDRGARGQRPRRARNRKRASRRRGARRARAGRAGQRGAIARRQRRTSPDDQRRRECKGRRRHRRRARLALQRNSRPRAHDRIHQGSRAAGARRPAHGLQNRRRLRRRRSQGRSCAEGRVERGRASALRSARISAQPAADAHALGHRADDARSDRASVGGCGRNRDAHRQGRSG